VVTVSHSILAGWGKHFSQLLNVHGLNNVRQIATHISVPLVPDPTAFDFEMVIEKLKRHKTPSIDRIPAESIKAPSTDRIPAESIKARGRTIRSEIHNPINSIWN